MGELNIKTVLMAGVDLARRRPATLLAWGVLFLLVDLGSYLLNPGEPDLRHIARGAVTRQLVLVVSFVFNAAIWTSAFRLLLRPSERRPLDLSWGADENRVLAVQIGVGLIVLIPEVVLMVTFGRSGGWATALTGLPSGLILAVISALTSFWTAIASVATFDRREMTVFAAWGHVRRGFGVLALAFLGVALAKALLWQIPLFAIAHAHGATVMDFPSRRASALIINQGPLVRSLIALYGAVLAVAAVALEAGIVATVYRAQRPAATAAS